MMLAFFYILSYCTAMPDPPAFMLRPRHRRKDDAPRAEIGDCIQIMARLCEVSLQNDWSLGFVHRTYFSRSAVNLSRTTYAYERTNGQNTDATLTAEKLEEGALLIVNALWGSYKILQGIRKSMLT